MRISHIRRGLYRWARILGDVQAVEKGPRAVERRAVNKAVYRASGRATRRALRSIRRWGL